MYLQHQSSTSATPQGQATDLLSLACLLSEPPKGRSSIQVAEGLLEAFECPRGIHRASDPELRLHGLGDKDIGHLRAAFALADSVLLQRLQSRPLFDRPDAVAAYVEHRYFSTSQEKMGVLFLNTRNRLLSEEVLFVGTLTRAVVEPRPILKRAILLDACTMLLWHSHPSGDPSPSSQDLSFTRRLSEAAQLMGLRLIDHIIVGGDGAWESMSRSNPNLFEAE